ncbi:pyridoxamine 5'-phosphate oxidase family protein [Streptomyces sp. SID14478]|uniref:pyridoxamine 5'-phosphate oxidase family protein n=1 Tax=Streptomyces sp. SID14478 TaxID=2706073 RepID=UPI0013DC6A9D|nr:pyridoxamine 5'-phosphate oxidase family protein [Streptomyces sp. SID14478]NEB74299.1 pyridoxamine 5'-phosphate oxidase family protein [Streptomyces sp. SID14478]
MSDEGLAPSQDVADLIGAPLDRVRRKISPVLHEWLQHFITLSPYVVVASTDGNGNCDASPRGGVPGFVKIIDRQTLFLPEESGNRLLQTFHNIRENPGVGLLFLIPGMRETARVNGSAEPVMRGTPDWDLLPLDGDERDRYVWGSRIEINEAYYHCGRATKFSNLWNLEDIAGNLAQPPLSKRPSQGTS